MKLAVAALLLGIAAPAAAQMPPPPAGGMMHDGTGRHGGNPMFAGMSDAGKQVMHAALHDGDPRADHEATHAARDRMLAVLDADRLDPVALRRAMDEEREAATAAKVRRQAALIAGFQQLSLADRRAFVVNARAMRNRIEDRMAMHGRPGPGGPGGSGPYGGPPPQ